MNVCDFFVMLFLLYTLIIKISNIQNEIMHDVRFHSQCLGSRCLDDGELTNQRPVLWPYDPSEATGRIDQTSLASQGFRIVNFYKHKHASCAAYLPSHVTTPKYSLL